MALRLRPLPRPPVSASFLISLTRYPYRRVLRVCSALVRLGEIVTTMTVWELPPTNESLRTCVSLEPRNGVWFCCVCARARVCVCMSVAGGGGGGGGGGGEGAAVGFRR